MKEIFTSEPRKVAVSRVKNGWLLTLNLGIKEVDGGYECESVTKELDHKPTVDDVRELFTEFVNKATDGKILSGFVWDGKNVWLSSENQFNFKAAFDVAAQTEGESLPVKFKLGEGEDGKPVYHTFEDFPEFSDFYMSAIAYTQQCLAEGWEEKDSFDESEYEGLLNNGE